MINGWRLPVVARPINRTYLRLVVLMLAIATLFVIGRWFLSKSFGTTFGFLFDPTGWDIAFSILPYTKNDPYWWAFLVGVTNTITAGALGVVGATTLGFVVGAAPLSGNRLLSDIARIYVNIVRNVPLILQAALWYGIILHFPPARSAFSILGEIYFSNRGLCIPKFSDTGTLIGAVILVGFLYWGIKSTHRFVQSRRNEPHSLWRSGVTIAVTISAAAGLALLLPRLPAAISIEAPVLKGLNFSGGFQIPPEFAALAAAIIVYRGAYIGEIFRGGFTSVARGQIEAAKALGLRPWMVLWKIRLPLALIVIVPPLASEYINIMKVTSIGIVIGFADLFMVSSNATMQTGRPLEVIFIMMLIYLILNYSISAAMNLVNRRLRVRGFS